VDLDKLKLETMLGKMIVPIGVVTSFSVQQGGAGGGMEGLVLYYPFDDDGGDVVHDASGNGITAKCSVPNGRPTVGSVAHMNFMVGQKKQAIAF